MFLLAILRAQKSQIERSRIADAPSAVCRACYPEIVHSPTRPLNQDKVLGTARSSLPWVVGFVALAIPSAMAHTAEPWLPTYWNSSGDLGDGNAAISSSDVVINDLTKTSSNSTSDEENPSSQESKKAGATDKKSKPKTLEEKLENWGRIYKDDKNATLQEFWLLGRYHGQQHWSEGSEGSDIGWENRRYRMGGQARMFEKLTVHAQMVSGSDFEPFYNGFTELWTQWAFSDEVALTIGQQKHRFTHDRNVSSRYINTLERSMLLNMFNADYTPAITLLGKIDKMTYYTGIFSNATERNMWDAFTELNSGYSLLAAAYFDVGDRIDADTAHYGVSYLFSDANTNATNLNIFEQGISNVLILTQGPSSLVSEGLIGLGSERGDAYGLNIQPGYFITDKLQLATRYQFAASEEADGLLPQRRYERAAGLTRGDVYHAAYVGFNYHVAGHRIKWMNGLEYSDLSGQNLWTASFAFRMFWGPQSSGPFPMAKTLKARK